MGAVMGSPSIGSDGYYIRPTATDERSTSSSPTKRYAELHTTVLTPNDHVQPPRRSVSDGAHLLLASKRGARDWNIDPKRTLTLTSSTSTYTPSIPPPVPPHKSKVSCRRPVGAPFVRRTRSSKTATSHEPTPSTSSLNHIHNGASHNEEADSDWDVEAAVQQRLVQFMFTVPREKLRVVNAEEGDLVSLSDGAKTGSRREVE